MRRRSDEKIDEQILGFVFAGKLRQNNLENNNSSLFCSEVRMLSYLKWSDTDNFNMNLGCHKVSRLYIEFSGKCLFIIFQGVGSVRGNFP